MSEFEVELPHRPEWDGTLAETRLAYVMTKYLAEQNKAIETLAREIGVNRAVLRNLFAHKATAVSAKNLVKIMAWLLDPMGTPAKIPPRPSGNRPKETKEKEANNGQAEENRQN